MAPAERPRNSHEASPVELKGRNEKGPYPNLLALLDLTDLAYFSLDSSGHLIKASNRLAHWLSTTPDALVGIPLASLCNPPHDTLLSEYLFRIGSTPPSKKATPETLHLFLSLQSAPPSSGSLDGTSSPNRIEGPPEGSHLTVATPADATPYHKHSAVPVELLMIVSDGIMSPDGAGNPEMAVQGLLRRRSPETPRARAWDAGNKSLAAESEQRNLRDRVVQMEQAVKELSELNQLRTEFVQNLSHELRTPLTFVRSYVQLILEEAMGEISSEVRKALTVVDQRTNVVTRLVDEVISLEQVEMGKVEFQPVSLAEIAARAIEGAVIAARKSGVSIELQVIDDLPLVHADPVRLGQVFDNLLGNAVKFSTANSSIHVRLWRDGTFVRADVEDHGIGIPADKLDQIFDRFYQVDGSTTHRYSGAGLGLAIVKTIVESLGGQVCVESEVGVGSTFTFLLPIPLIVKTGDQASKRL